MKKMVILLAFSIVLLAVPFSLPAYDDSASSVKVIPECIWAPASGGGTWRTEIQITNMASDPTNVSVIFFYGGGLYQGPVTLVTGLTVSIFQAATQINEQTLSFVPKLVATFITLVLAGPWMITQMTDFIRRLFESIPQMIG